MYTDIDFEAFGQEQEKKLEAGFVCNDLVAFLHEGAVIVNPYAHTLGNPVDIFGGPNMFCWRTKVAQIMDERRGYSLPSDCSMTDRQKARLHELVSRNPAKHAYLVAMGWGK